MQNEKKEFLKLLSFSVITAIVIRYISIHFIWKNMEATKIDFHKNLIKIDAYQQKITENFYLELACLFVLPYVLAILFYFLTKINLKPKNNFLVFILAFTVLFFASYILIGYACKFLE
jgi:hypothetical protein